MLESIIHIPSGGLYGQGPLNLWMIISYKCKIKGSTNDKCYAKVWYFPFTDFQRRKTRHVYGEISTPEKVKWLKKACITRRSGVPSSLKKHQKHGKICQCYRCEWKMSFSMSISDTAAILVYYYFQYTKAIASSWFEFLIMILVKCTLFKYVIRCWAVFCCKQITNKWHAQMGSFLNLMVSK